MEGRDSGHLSGLGRFVRPVVEYGIVLGLCMFGLVVVVPQGTQQTENFGLSPRMVPTVTLIAIAIFSFVGLVLDIQKKQIPSASNTGIGGVLLLLISIGFGVAALHHFGLVIGGMVLVVLCAVALGQHGLLFLSAMGISALALLAMVNWLGL